MMNTRMSALAGAALTALAGLGLSACANLNDLRNEITGGGSPSAAPAESASAATPASAPIHPLLHPLFAEHGVLQREKPIRVWGWSRPSSSVTVSLGEASATATADSSGRWEASIPAMRAGGPYRLSARSSSGESQSVEDVMVGDVWLCSGQSNMEWPLVASANGRSEIENSSHPNIRLFTVPKASRSAPLDSFVERTSWGVSGPGVTDEFSAACYFMGRELAGSQNVPIGLIDSTWGGTRIEAWTSPMGLAGVSDFSEQLAMMDFYQASPDAAQLSWNATLARWWRQNDPASRAAVPWSAPEFDASAWPTTNASGAWERTGEQRLANFDGVVWYRTSVTLSVAQARQGALLSIGPVDDQDSVWVNGTFVGGGEGYNRPRNYAISAGLLKPGANLIAVGVLDTGGDGGMTGPASDKVLRFADNSSVPLNGAWRWQISAPLSQTGSAPQAPWGDANGLSALNNGMIANVAPYAIRGVAWYQGEANVGAPALYRRLLPAMMADWRRQFATPDLPFLIVQLANFGPVTTAPVESGWAGVREAQRLSVNADRNAGMVVTIDIGDRYDIHPTNKQEVGRRLGLVARDVAYKQPVSSSGPTPASARRSRNAVVVSFANAGERLVTWGGGRPTGFELCDAERRCTFVDATVNGPRVSLDASRVRRAAFVRYCWADSPVCTLANAQGLPATPFEVAVQ